MSRLGCPKIVVPVQVVFLGPEENTVGSEREKKTSIEECLLAAHYVSF